MRSYGLWFGIAAFVAATHLATSVCLAQFGGSGRKTETADEFAKKVMAFDKSKDGKLTKAELVDRRLHGLFDRANTKKKKYITTSELKALFRRESLAGGGAGQPPRGPRSGPERFGPPRPGQVLPRFLQDQLKLSSKQKQQLLKLQKEVDAKLEKILTKQQRDQLQALGRRRPGRFGLPNQRRTTRPPSLSQLESRPRERK
ncbi:MAG: EF-hand domain-containing protein [Gemmataceae bacterium]